jgi:hypothetical protein
MPLVGASMALLLSVVIDNLDVEGIAAAEPAAQPPLVIDADAVLPGAVTLVLWPAAPLPMGGGLLCLAAQPAR